MPAFGGALLALLRHDAGGMRLGAQRDGQHFVRRRHFQIEGNFYLAAEAGDIVVGNMPPVFPQMGGDAVGARLFR